MTDHSRQGWRVVACLSVVVLVLWGSALSFGVFVRPLIVSFNWSHARVSLLFTALMLAMGIADPAAGWLLERIEGNIIIIIGALITAAGFLAASRADSFGALFLAYVACGVGLAFSSLPPATAITPHWFEEQRGLALGVVAGAAALGGVLMPLLAERAQEAYGWRGGYVAFAVPILIILPWVYATVRSRPPEAVEKLASPRELAGLNVGEAIRTLGLWLIMLSYLGWATMIGMPIAHLIAFLRGIGYGPLQATLAFSAMQLMAVPGCVILGALGDRLEGRGICAGGLVLSGLGLLALPRASSAGALGLFVVLFGISFLAPAGLLPLILSRLVGLKRYRLFAGITLLAMNFGVAIGPVFAGKIIDATGSYTQVFNLASAISIFVALLVVAMPRSRVLAVAPS